MSLSEPLRKVFHLHVLSQVFLTLALAVCLNNIRFAAAAIPPTRFCSTRATILSEDLTSCKNTSAPSCKGGLSSAMAFVRDMRSREGAVVSLVPYLDRQSSFVQMHPLEWNVNQVAFERWGIPAFWSTHALATTPRNLSLLQTKAVPFVLSNILVEPEALWYGYQVRDYFDTATRIGFLTIQSIAQPNSIGWKRVARSALLNLHRQKPLAVIVMIWSEVGWEEAVKTLREFDHPPDIIWSEDAPEYAYFNQTHIVEGDFADDRLTCVDLKFDVSGKLLNATRLSKDLHAVPHELKDFTYYNDVGYWQSQADLAAAFDPVVGYTTRMPFVRIEELRMCMAGECPLGNLWTDAIRWKYNTDVAFEPSGGLRGLGWEIGPVRMSNLWSALPFANQPCNGTILGLRLFEILNFSSSAATFEGAKTSLGDRLMQVSGLRYTVNTQMSPSRLISVEILDRTTRQYVPLERLKLYTFTTNSFVCQHFAPFNNYFTEAAYAGERAGVLDDALVQNVVSEYLAAHSSASSPLVVGTDNRIRNDTTATKFLDWVQRRIDCSANNYWDPSVATCKRCPAGQEQPERGQLDCSPIVDNTIIIVASSVPLALLIIALVIFMIVLKMKLGDVRDVKNAPTTGKITLIFTDIQDSTKLWSTVPQSMSVSLDIHHQIIREEIVRYKAYEVKTQGDSFMIAIANEEDAIRLAVAVQRRLQDQIFPNCINKVYLAEKDQDLDRIEDDPEDTELVSGNWSKSGRALTIASRGFNGLRVRIGIHSGDPQAVFDEVSKGYDYYGPPVNLAARVEAAAAGGQVLITQNVLDELQLSAPRRNKGGKDSLDDRSSSSSGGHTPRYSSVLDDLEWGSVGFHSLKGVHGKQELFQLVPQELHRHGRVFDITDPEKNIPLKDEEDECLEVSEHSLGGWSAVSGLAEQLSLFPIFFTALLRALRPKDKQTVRSLLSKAWRVPLSEEGAEDQDAELCSRIQQTLAARSKSRSLMAAAPRPPTSSTAIVGSSPQPAANVLLPPSSLDTPSSALRGGDFSNI